MNQVDGSSRIIETEVVEKAKRRQFTAEFKQRILGEVDRASKSGEIGAILRREGLYSSVLAVWRRQREAGEFLALTPRRRGPVPKVRDARDQEMAQLKRKLLTAEVRLRRAEALLDLQKKVSEILGIELPPRPPEEPL